MGDALHTHGGVTDAKEARLAQAGLIAVQGPTALDARTGVLAGPGTTTLVTGTSATAPMTVAVAPHQWVTSRGAANGPYLGALEASTAVTIAAAPAAGAGTRIDVVYDKQQDATPGVPTPDATTAPLYGVVTGVPGGGKPALPVGALELATVAVAPGATATNGAGVTITNTARQTVARGGIVPTRDQADRDSLTTYDGLTVARLDAKRLETYLGGWRGVTPIPYSTVTVDGTQYLVTQPVLTITIPDPGFPYRIVGQGSLGVLVAPGVTVAMRYRVNGTDLPGVGPDFTNNGGASVTASIATAQSTSGTLTGASTVQGVVWKTGNAAGAFQATPGSLYTQLSALVVPV